MKKISGNNIITGLLIVAVAGLSYAVLKPSQPSLEKSESDKIIGSSQVTENGDLVIPIREVTSNATFYPVTVDGTELEVMAVLAEDGTVRTAFNTCQVCYSSGRGYYEQIGDQLVCQNCRNRFSSNMIERMRGGCNPIPITQSDKVIDEETITIPNSFLQDSKDIFSNWKR